MDATSVNQLKNIGVLFLSSWIVVPLSDERPVFILSAYERAHERYRPSEHDLGWSMEDDFDDMM